jgi:orotidine-5'-phosphate decarboxylase
MTTTLFLEKYKKTRDEKGSILCVGLDPATKELRKENIIPKKYMLGKEEEELGEGILNFCLEIIEKTSDHATCVKVNSQYVLFLMNLKQLKKLNERAHSLGLISILDHKLGDISESNLPALFWTKEAGFDALTFSPFAGNIEDTTRNAHKFNLGVFVLTLMSNLESVWIQKKSFFEKNRPLYQEIAKKSALAKADGLVIGATHHITEEDIKEVRKISGNERIFLFPGIGFQGGNMEKIIKSAGENLLINVSRAILYDKNPGEKAKEFNEEINKFFMRKKKGRECH